MSQVSWSPGVTTGPCSSSSSSHGPTLHHYCCLLAPSLLLMARAYQTYTTSAKFGTLAMGEVGTSSVASDPNHGLRRSPPPRASPDPSSSCGAPPDTRCLPGCSAGLPVSQVPWVTRGKCPGEVQCRGQGESGEEEEEEEQAARGCDTPARRSLPGLTVSQVSPTKSSAETDLCDHNLRCVGPNVKEKAPEIACLGGGRGSGDWWRCSTWCHGQPRGEPPPPPPPPPVTRNAVKYTKKKKSTSWTVM